MREQTILTPSGLNQYIKSALDRDRLLANVMVSGELSNYKQYSSGHHYFSLKDSEGTIRGVMFRGDASSLRFRPQNGMKVIATGRVTVFPRDGQYQLYCTRLVPDGVGDLHVAFEQSKERLQQMGYFSPEHKKLLPRYPERIALITSPSGAAVRDMIRVLGARFPLSEVKILPVHVQGEGAAEEIAAAIGWANYYEVADLIIAGRGGGSMEDLWAFNEEVVANAIYHSEIPVISAVGHEPDFTIADFVADVRAATPSNGAELAVPDSRELQSWLQGAQGYMLRQLSQQIARHRTNLTRIDGSMNRQMTQVISLYRLQLERIASSRLMTEPKTYVQEKRMLLDYQQSRLSGALKSNVSRQQHRFGSMVAKLDALSPLKVLGRGYSIARLDEGTVLTSSAQVNVGDPLELKLSDGTLHCTVDEKT